MFVNGFFPVFSLEYFLQTILRVSIRLISCFLLFKEYVFVVLSISSSKPFINSSIWVIGSPLKVNSGLLWILPFGVIKIVASINPFADTFFLSLIDCESSSTLIDPST